jgi:hypothetical protein
MTRQTMIRSRRCTLVAALLGALLAMTAGEAATVTAQILAPGLAPTAGTAVVVGPDTYAIPFATTALALDMDCGAPAATCSLWVARNNGAQATEALFANQTGSRTNIPVGFVNDGCFNFRLYDSAHAQLYIQINIGHGNINEAVCNTNGTATSKVMYNGGSGAVAYGGTNGVVANFLPPASHLPVDWDSGLAGGVEDSQVWITCNQSRFPDGTEVLYAQDVSGEKTDLNLLGGGPYCFNLYQGTSHTTSIASVTIYINPYLQYAGGTANPVAGKDNSGGTVYFNSSHGGINALVCVWGNAIPGSDILHQTPLSFNSEGYGSAVASFQSVGKGVVGYELHVGVTGLDASGAPTPASCNTGSIPVPRFYVDS